MGIWRVSRSTWPYSLAVGVWSTKYESRSCIKDGLACRVADGPISFINQDSLKRLHDRVYPGLAKVLAEFPAGNIQFQTPQHCFDAMPNPTLPSYPITHCCLE
eukprot:1141855-Pelagomonas_calceolata.AAC.1